MIRLAFNGCFPTAELYGSFASRLPQARFVAVVEPDTQLARQAAETLDATITASSLERLLSDHADDFDAVVIHSSLSSRVDAVKQAANGQKHVLVVGPMAASTPRADQAIEACRVAGVRLMVGHAQRFLPAHSAVQRALASGKLGQPGLLRIHQWLPRDTAAVADENESAEPRATWTEPLTSEFDLANWFFQALPTSVFAVARSASETGTNGSSNTPLEDPDYVQVHLAFRNDGMALIDYSTAVPSGSGYRSLSLIGSSGAAYADDHRNMHLLFRGGEPTAVQGDQGERHWLTQLEEFTDSIQQSREPSVSGVDGRAAVQVAEAVMESIASQSSVGLS